MSKKSRVVEVREVRSGHGRYARQAQLRSVPCIQINFNARGDSMASEKGRDLSCE